jgi:LPS sulfotransferase NodH
VHLTRRNLLERVLSSHVREVTDVTHARTDVPLPTVTVKPSQVAEEVKGADRRIAKARALLRIYPGHVLEISYEGLRREPDRVSASVLRFLGEDPIPYSPAGKLRKIVDRDYREVVANYGQIVEEIDRRGIRYQL